MLKIVTGVLLAVVLAACQHQQTMDTAYRIDRVIVEPVPYRGRSIQTRSILDNLLRSKLQVVANDINSQLAPSTASRDMIVRVESVKYVAPKGPFVVGRSRIKGKISLVSPSGSKTYRFSVSDDGQPGLGDAFNLGGFFSETASFGRITDRTAAGFSKRYSREHGTRRIGRGNLVGVPLHQNRPPARPGETPPPPLVLVGH